MKVECIIRFIIFRLIHSVIGRMMKPKTSNAALAPAMIETYSRLLVYIEIESLGIKGFISKYNICNCQSRNLLTVSSFYSVF